MALEAIEHDHPLLARDGDGTSITRLARNIGSGFSFMASHGDSEFHPLHVEPLLDQAADLLDRGVRDRATWDDLGTKYISQMLELHEYAELDKIHRKEERAGIYDIPTYSSIADYKAYKNGFQDASERSRLSAILINSELSREKAVTLWWEAYRGGWAPSLPSYSYGERNFKGYHSYVFKDGEPSRSVGNHAGLAAATLAYAALERESLYAAIQKLTHEQESSTQLARQEAAKRQVRWDLANAGFQRERTQVARRLQDIKALFATAPDGLLNHAKRMTGLEERFNSDFRHALARLRAIEPGLRELYDFAAPLPSDETLPSFFDDCLSWTRSAIQHLVRFARSEQTIIVSLSLRELLGNDRWRHGRAKGTWEFDILQEHFPGLHSIRLRGLSAYVRTCSLGSRSRIWNFSVRPPTQGIYLTEKRLERHLDQSRIKAARASRVAARGSNQSPDVCGAAVWHNASPIGTWLIDRLGATPVSRFDALLKDISMDFYVVAKTDKSS